MLFTLSRSWKSLEAPGIAAVQLPSFSVITGANGSGKSNLLEALQQGAGVIAELGPLDAQTARLFKLGELVTVTEGPVNAASYRDPWSQLYNNIESWKQQFSVNPNAFGFTGGPGELGSWLRQQVVNSQLMSEAEYDRMILRARRPIEQMEVADFARAAPAIIGFRDPFLASLSEIFLTYSLRRDQEMFTAYRAAQLGQAGAFDVADFEQRFGREPWLVLDEILQIVGLPYRFEAPPQAVENLNYQPQLEHLEGQQPINPADLSSGEKVLLSIAMTLFTSGNFGGSVRLPRLLLLDEPDASLHPSMVKSLLRVVQEVIVGQQGVPTIMTTHSPTTVALAPPESLFVMRRTESPRLVPAERQRAIRALTVGIPTMAVRMEDRRQVFVESEVDQACYQALYDLVADRIEAPTSLEFISVGRRDRGGGSEAVLRLVPALREAGAETVAGIVDRDERSATPTGVEFVASRHSLENLVLDPLGLAVLLIRENIATSAELGAEAGLRASTISGRHHQSLVDGILREVSLAGEPTQIVYVGGSSVVVSSEYLSTRGHDVEAAVMSRFAGLNRFRGDLKGELIRRVYADYPLLIPQDCLRLFERLSDL